MLLPLGMTTTVVCKANLRTLIDMSHQRMCSRAYHEFRQLFNDLIEALASHSDEWRMIVRTCFCPKCDLTGVCPEKKGCGRHPKKGEQV